MKKPAPSNDTIRFTATLERSDNKLWGCHFRVPNLVVKQLVERASRRVVCTLNSTAEYQCALLPHGNGSFVITVNKKLRDTLELSFGAEVQVSLKKDKSTYGLPIPEELLALFQQEAGGKILFHALTPGKQRTLLYIIGSAKSSEKRVARSITVVNHLKANSGRIDYKKLSASLEDPRRSLM